LRTHLYIIKDYRQDYFENTARKAQDCSYNRQRRHRYDNCCTLVALLASLLPAFAAAPVTYIGFQCANDPQNWARTHSYAHERAAVAQADATAESARICQHFFHGPAVNVFVKSADGTTAKIPSAIAPSQ
jgi:hypothetical protein